MTSSSNTLQFILRFSSSNLKGWLMQQSKINHRSLNAEINFQLEQIMLKQQKEQPHETQKA